MHICMQCVQYMQMSGVREVEDLLIECIYGGLLQGRFDQAAAQLDVFSSSSRVSEGEGVGEGG